MRNLCLLISMVALFVGGCASLTPASGERSTVLAEEKNCIGNCDNPSRFAGVWQLVSFHTQDPSGQIAYPFGRDARGRLVYEPNGRMAVQLMDPKRPAFTSGDPLRTSEAEVREAFGGYTAYYGTYSLNEGEQIITHHIEAALLPNWVGTDQIRHFEYDGKYLTLTGPLLLGGIQGTVSLVWERLP